MTLSSVSYTHLDVYKRQVEGEGIWDFLFEIWQTMQACIKQGLLSMGTLPGGLDIERRAYSLYHGGHMDESAATRENRLICAYAFAAGEQNAAGGTVVTAPTCGACGVLPAVLLYTQQTRGTSDSQVLRALATGGLMGNLIKMCIRDRPVQARRQRPLSPKIPLSRDFLLTFYV